MSLIKISNLPPAAALTGNELLPVVQGGVTKRTTASAFSNAAGPPGPAGPQGPAGTPGNSGAIVDWISVKDHGAVGDGVTDDTAAIQAAIDFAFAQLIQVVYIPRGNYKTTSTLYLDPPTNMRAHGDVGVTGAFSLCFRGDSHGNSENMSVTIQPTAINVPCILVGPGQYMCIENIRVLGAEAAYRGNKTQNGPKGTSTVAGIAYAAFGTATQTRTENVQVENWYYGFMTGWGGDGLGDSNTWIKCVVYNSAVGWWIQQTQNFINSLYDCTCGGVSTCLIATNGQGVHIFGGNYAATSNVANSLAISAVSSFTVVDPGNGNYQFTATMTPDVNVPNVYSAYTFETTHYGIVPATLLTWNSNTNQATFKLLKEWVDSNYVGVDISTHSNLLTELQAQTKVFGSEFPVVFKACGISVIGIHNEMTAEGPERLIETDVTFGAAKPSVLMNINVNHDPAGVDLLPLTDDTRKAKYYACQNFGFIKVVSAGVTITDSTLGNSGNSGPDPSLIDGAPSGFPFVVERCANTFFNYRVAAATINFLDLPNAKFDLPYCMFNSSRRDYASVFTDQQNSPFWGIRPAQWCMPGLVPADVTTLSGVLPAIGPNSVSYPAGIWGGHVYSISQFQYSSISNHRFFSNHHFMSYGQNITTTNCTGCSWSYIGQSSVVYMDANSMTFMKQGLGITLNNGTSDILYLVTAIFPGLGYVQVENKSGSFLTSALKTAIVTGTIIKQDPYSITQIT